MSVQFKSFQEWKQYCESESVPLWQPVMDFGISQKSRTEEEIWSGLSAAYAVIKNAVKKRLSDDMKSHSGMINGDSQKAKLTPNTSGLQRISIAHC